MTPSNLFGGVKIQETDVNAVIRKLAIISLIATVTLIGGLWAFTYHTKLAFNVCASLAIISLASDYVVRILHGPEDDPPDQDVTDGRINAPHTTNLEGYMSTNLRTEIGILAWGILLCATSSAILTGMGLNNVRAHVATFCTCVLLYSCWVFRFWILYWLLPEVSIDKEEEDVPLGVRVVTLSGLILVCLIIATVIVAIIVASFGT